MRWPRGVFIGGHYKGRGRHEGQGHEPAFGCRGRVCGVECRDKIREVVKHFAGLIWDFSHGPCVGVALGLSLNEVVRVAQPIEFEISPANECGETECRAVFRTAWKPACSRWIPISDARGFFRGRRTRVSPPAIRVLRTPQSFHPRVNPPVEFLSPLRQISTSIRTVRCRSLSVNSPSHPLALLSGYREKYTV